MIPDAVRAAMVRDLRETLASYTEHNAALAAAAIRSGERDDCPNMRCLIDAWAIGYNAGVSWSQREYPALAAKEEFGL